MKSSRHIQKYPMYQLNLMVVKKFIKDIEHFTTKSKKYYMGGQIIINGSKYEFDYTPSLTDFRIKTSFDDGIEFVLLYRFNGLLLRTVGKEDERKLISYFGQVYKFIKDIYCFLKEYNQRTMLS